MTPERHKVVCELWKRERQRAFANFSKHPVWCLAEPLSFPEPYAIEGGPAATTPHIEFHYQVAHPSPSGGRAWRIVCEGAVVDYGVN